MVFIISAEDTIPIFTASGKISLNTASICDATTSQGISYTPKTPVVFCEVTEFITLIPKTPLAANDFKSACIPAPPLESEPAIVKAVFISFLQSCYINLLSPSQYHLVQKYPKQLPHRLCLYPLIEVHYHRQFRRLRQRVY